MKQKLEQAILQQDIPEIEACLTRYEACNPTDFDLFSYKISLALLKEDFQAAYDLAKTAITLNPFDVEANYNFMVCARSLGKYAVAYQSFLMIQFVQMRYRITVINDETLAVWEQEFQILAAEDTDLENEFSRIEQNHRYAILDPFKNYQESLCGKILTCYNGQQYYIGLADNWYESYFNFSFIKDPIHAKCELFPIADISTKYDIPADLGKVLVPICLNYDLTQKDSNYITDAAKDPTKFYRESAREKYCYLPVENGTALRTAYPTVFGTPIPLTHPDANGRKKLVLSIFIDSFNYYLVKDLGLETLMPETFRYFSKGIICNNYYSGSEWTLPSIATYWTGKHSSHHMNLMEDYRFDFMKDSKVLSEYFHDAGYVTAKIGGNDAVTPWQGYIRGIDRFTHQYSSQAYRTKEVISDVIQQIETFKDACQYIWFDFLDLHDIAGGFMCSLPVQSRLPLAARHIDNDITTTVKQSFSPNRREIYIQQLRELDFYLGILYQYLERNYKDEEIIVSLFSDHGTAFMVEDGKPFLSEQRVNVPFMLRCSNLSPRVSDELIETADYTAILCKLAGIPYHFEGTDANLPLTFGGKQERDYTFSQNIFPGDPYRAALHGKDFHFYMDSTIPVSPDLRIDLTGRKCLLTDTKGHPVQDEVLMKKYEAIIKKEIAHLLIYPLAGN